MFSLPQLVRLSVLLVTLGSIGLAAPGSRLVNLSSRAVVATGDNILIAGFVVGGTAPKDVLLRCVGPTLANYGVTSALSKPRLQVFNSKGVVVLTQEGWDPSLKAAFSQVGASALPDDSKDAAFRARLAPGAYSAQVSGVGGGRGIAMVEVYEMDANASLLNLSTRARVEGGDGVLISGLVMSGSGSRRLLIRAGGPFLRQYGLTDVLSDPILSVYDRSGSLVASNDDWEAAGASEILNASSGCGATAFAGGSKDAALFVDVAPGIYTIQVRGAAESAGIALLEVYDVTAIRPDLATTGGITAIGAYTTASLSWASADVDARLGPKFNAGAVDDRPLIPGRESKTPPAKYYVRIRPYELGAEPGADSDYWSDSGQVAYVPNDPATDPGLDRIQTFAYYNKVFAISPRLDWASGKPHPDLQARDPSYAKLNGKAPMQPVAMVRNYAMEQNEALVIYRDGLFAVAGTQTSRAGSERPYPGFKFPATKIPRAVAVTTSNEFALVTVWDTARHVGQLAVVALEGRYIPFHTWPYMALPNQGSWSDFKLLGYIDLPMSSPDAVAAASNGLWAGPSSTDNKVLSQIPLAQDGYRKLLYDGGWQGTVAKNGYAIVSSKADNRVAVVDLTPLFTYARDSWLSSAESFQATLAARGAAASQFPQTFDVNPAIKPKVVWQAAMTRPTAVLAGQKLDRWSKDRFKAYVATESGAIHIIDASSLMQRFSWETRGKLEEIGSFNVGKNPVSMVFARHGVSKLPLLPNDTTGTQRQADSLNNLLYVACRGDRSIDAVVTWQGSGAVYDRIRDQRMGDPVAVSVARRGHIVSVADYTGKKILSYRMGTLRDARNDVEYPPIDPAYRYEFAGELPLAGSPFLLNSTNVN